MRASGKRRLAGLFVVVVSIVGFGFRPALADIASSTATNAEDGNNNSHGNQRGSSSSGDANGGQIAGVVVSNGRASLDATNVSKDSSATSGDSRGSNTAHSLTGVSSADDISVGAADITNVNADYVQDGNNRLTYSQAVAANTGDAVAGEVIGAVVTGGTTSIVASNTTNNSDATTGDANGDNSFAAIVGLADSSSITVAADITGVTGATDIQEGNDNATARQSANSTTGDGVAGQVIGVVSGGATSVDATNRSDDVTATTGDSHADNSYATQVGLDCTGTELVTAADIIDTAVTCEVQEGDNRSTASQDTTGTTGDAVAGEVIGAVTSAGGSNSIVAANSSTTSDATTGDAHAFADAASRVGLSCPNRFSVTADISGVGRACDMQEGNNRSTSAQTTTASTGDGVAGQVLGSVSAGATSIDARNATANSTADSGDSTASNDAAAVVGDYCPGPETITADIIDSRSSCELQEGNNRSTSAQRANSGSGDAVSGQVAGAVTSAGGSNSIVLANATNNTDSTSGDTDAANAAAAEVGVSCPGDEIISADIIDSTSSCDVQEGNDRTSTSQSADATSGDAVGGQVAGSVSAGATSIDASNRTDDSSATTGDSDATNGAAVRAGVFCPSDQTITATDLSGVTGSCSMQEGNDTTRATQNARSATGDGVAGEVIGAVTSAGGSNSIVAANRSATMDVTTGDGDADNAFVGVAAVDCPSDQALIADVIDSTSPCDLQEGNNRSTGTQNASAVTGDGVGGQVIGSVSAGRTSIDANNSSTNSSVDTGDSDADNGAVAFAGTDCVGDQTFTADITTSSSDCNLQSGDNRSTAAQTAAATSGDGVAGEVIGAVTSAGGSASIVAANGTDNSDVNTGDADADNGLVAYAGHACAASTTFTADIIDSTGSCNVQDGSNRATGSQTAAATTGDGVAGQVLGVVSAGATSVDANNRTTDSSAQTGDADATNSGVAFAGLADVGDPGIVLTADISGASGDLIQDGNNRQTLSQSANATTGDGVAGQVTGVVTSAGGSASVVVANTSSSLDVLSGDSRFENSQTGFVGLAFPRGPLTLG